MRRLAAPLLALALLFAGPLAVGAADKSEPQGRLEMKDGRAVALGWIYGHPINCMAHAV